MRAVSWLVYGCSVGELHSSPQIELMIVSRLMGADYAAINFNGLVDASEARTVEDMLMWY